MIRWQQNKFSGTCKSKTVIDHCKTYFKLPRSILLATQSKERNTDILIQIEVFIGELLRINWNLLVVVTIHILLILNKRKTISHQAMFVSTISDQLKENNISANIKELQVLLMDGHTHTRE